MFELVDNSISIQNKSYLENPDKIFENADDMLS